MAKKKEQKVVITEDAKEVNGLPLRQDTHLAEGEVTGHFHTVEGVGVRVFGGGFTRVLHAPKGGKVTHAEHSTQVLPKHMHDVPQEVLRVNEEDPFLQELRPVVD